MEAEKKPENGFGAMSLDSELALGIAEMCLAYR
jgi:hypothetical protein